MPASVASRVSTFAIPGMDCPAEERLVRLALAPEAGIHALEFDLAGHRLRIEHDGESAALLQRLEPLGMGARLEFSAGLHATSRGGERIVAAGEGDAREASTLRVLLAINAAMFLVELVAGWRAESAGLLADSLDMLADALVYGLALHAVGRAPRHKLRTAHGAGWLQMALALGALAEVGRRAVFGSEPVSGLMMGIALLALLANSCCLWLVSRQRDRGAHMRASWIFSANDVLANLGVIAAGALVAWTGAAWPDLVIGTVIGLVVLNGARRILAIRS